MTLLERLQALSRSELLAMHMPGHKRNTALAPYLDTLGAELDITEITDFGNLHDPEGILADRMVLAAQLWGSKRAWWLIGGSTAGLLSAIDAATNAGDTVLMGRNCHKSVYNACMLCRLNPVYIRPHLYEGCSFSAAITPAQVEQALTEHPDTRLVVLTSPTYEGLLSDIPAISDIVHRHGAVLLVDEAHGAHLGLHPDFPASAVTQGADMVVQSLHKTLPSLTQTALLHLCSDRVSAEELGFRLSVYQTSSPSYLLMASIDSCVGLLTEQKDTLFHLWHRHLGSFHEALCLRHLSMPIVRNEYTDPSKLLISTAGTTITGPQLAVILREEYGIETEMSTSDTVLCMTGLGDTEADLLCLAEALNAIDGTIGFSPAPAPLSVPLPRAGMPICEAVKKETELVSLEDSVGRMSGDFLWAYPPGVPLVTPGEIMSRALMEYMASAKEAGIHISGPKGAPEGSVRVLKRG